MSSTNRRWSLEAMGAVTSYEHAAHTLQKNLLNARAGLLRNYDPVNFDIDLANRSLYQLAHLARNDEFSAEIGSALRRVREQEALAEEFKSKNALLHNSLARFTLSSNAKPQSARERDLSARILQLTLDTSPNTVQAARQAVADFKRTESGSELIPHAELLTTILPEIDQILLMFRSSRLAPGTRRLQILLAEEARTREAALRIRQFGLAGFAILSVGLLALLATSIKRRTHDLKYRVEKERLCAAVANLFINVNGTEFEERMQLAVKWLSAHIDATRAHLRVHSGVHERQVDWSATPSHSRGSLDAVIAVAEKNLSWRNDILFIPDLSCRSALCEKMLQDDIASLLVVRAFQPVQAVLGFELRARARARRFPPHFDAISKAFGIILEAARREVLAAEREQSERQLARARRMETIGAMASGVAHNFNNIIGAISGFGEMAAAHISPNSVAGRSLGEIRRAVDRARNLVREILSFGMSDRHERELIFIPHLIDETMRLFQATPNCHAKAVMTLNGTMDCVLGRTTQIQQVLLNICNNAAIANIDGKPISLELSSKTLRNSRKLSHSAIDAGQYVVISVRDEGVGIPPVVLPRIFEPFFTTRPAGTGLGLSTAWEIIQEHGGSIDVHSELKIGSRFSIWLPVASADEQALAQMAPIGEGEPILLLTDQDAMAPQEELLAMLGYEPVSCTVEEILSSVRPLVDTVSAVLLVDSGGNDLRQSAVDLAPLLNDKPLVIATRTTGEVMRHPRCRVITYPLKSTEIATALYSLL